MALYLYRPNKKQIKPYEKVLIRLLNQLIRLLNQLQFHSLPITVY